MCSFVLSIAPSISMIGKAVRDPDHFVLENMMRKRMAAVSGPDKEVVQDEEVIIKFTKSMQRAVAQGSAWLWMRLRYVHNLGGFAKQG